MEFIDRPDYLDWLRRWRDHDVAKVVTGVRRCGKSTILTLFRRELAAQGVPVERIWTFNLEDPDIERRYGQGLELYNAVRDVVSADSMNYIFIDEAPHLAEVERTVAGLGLLPNVDLYLTGSNSRFSSGDLATRLTGRFVELHALPLSFREYLKAPPAEAVSQPRDAWRNYLVRGGFPYTARLDEAMGREYLTDLLNTIILRDIAPRQQSLSPALFDGILSFMFDNVGNLTSFNKISNTLTSLGRKTGRAAVDNYLTGLIESYLLYPARRYDIKGKRNLEGPAKYYLVDLGLRRAVLGTNNPAWGHVLENVVFLELLRRNCKVSVGKVADAEVDFLADGPDGTVYIQVCQSVADPATLDRELAPLKAIGDHHPKLLLVGDDLPPASHNGIRQLSVPDWLSSYQAQALRGRQTGATLESAATRRIIDLG
ncbi:MAG: ATP-binding protein [Bifidobacteriaceae bacterium]|jgi:predicted AAA+ superfamily ATPase|nr:ATP-binding protein [Bifidobacteriaceae bacterium]